MKILIIGNGGREHALAWKAAQSPKVSSVFVAPGNAGTALEDKTTNIDIAITDIPALVNFAKNEGIDLTIVGPEAALAVGIVDSFTEANLACFGPTKAAAQLESSKAFSKAFMKRHQIPTANYECFDEIPLAKQFLHNKSYPIVIKADGLAAGKGVIIANNQKEAFDAIEWMLTGNAFGTAGARVIIEDYLEGEELSFIVMVDGQHVLPLATSQDHKRRDNADKGPNTGGMGAYSPAPFSSQLEQRILADVIEPTVNGMKSEGHPYKGFLYAGLIITPKNEIKVLEFNCRLGDPETQPILMRLQSDLVELCYEALKGKLNLTSIEWDKRAALGVVLVSKGYPENYLTGEIISGLDSHSNSRYKIFHAGTRIINHHIVTAGGRVLCVTALGQTISEAQQLAYQVAKQIHWDHIYYRTDIGYRAVNRETTLAENS